MALENRTSVTKLTTLLLSFLLLHFLSAAFAISDVILGGVFDVVSTRVVVVKVADVVDAFSKVAQIDVGVTFGQRLSLQIILADTLKKKFFFKSDI